MSYEWDGDVVRKSPSGEVTTWWGVPAMSQMVNIPPDGTFCQFYADGRVTMSLNNVTWFWGPPEPGIVTEGYVRILSCTCAANLKEDEIWRR